MCSSSHQKFIQHIMLLHIVFLLAIIAMASSDQDRPKELKFVPWGHRCKIPNKGENLKPTDRCDESVGIVCQKYTQGEYCGCRQENNVPGAETVSYDTRSKQCRLKVGQFCHYVNATAYPDFYASLPFNSKCHENAECKNVRLISKNENHKKSDDATCICKDGYIASKDLAQCHDPNSAASPVANQFVYGLALLFVSVKYRLIL